MGKTHTPSEGIATMTTTSYFPADFHSERRTVVRFGETFVVHAFRIIGTQTVVFEAYEASAYTGPHGTVRSDAELGPIGAITSRRSPVVEQLRPGSQERFDAAKQHRHEQQAVADYLVRIAYAGDVDFDHASKMGSRYEVEMAAA